MASGKLTPRQKMINMMYLVLTALLALNVSKEIINAFVTVNESLEVSKANVITKNSQTYAAFEQAMQNDPKKYGDVNTKALEIKKASDDLGKFIEDIKIDLVRKVDAVKDGDPTPGLREMGKKDDYDIPTNYMNGDANDGRGSKATELKDKIDAYKKMLVSKMPEDQRADAKTKMDNLLDTRDPDPGSKEYKDDGKRTWEMSKFYHNPVVASVALLTKFQTDIRNAEAQTIDHLLASVDKNIVKLDVLQAKVIANSTVVTIGNEYQADVFLSATSSTLAPDVFIGATYDSTSKTIKGGSDKPLPVDGGIAKYSSRPGSEGEQKWGGVIRVKKPDNTFDYYPFQSSYIAQKPNSVVSADKMNVLYIGVDNPMSISVPGVPNNKVKASIEGGGGSLKPDPKAGGGHYIANVTTTGNSTIKVSAEIGGKQMPMGSFTFRVKRVPDPIATLGGNNEGGNINKNLLMASNLIPVLKNFDFELFFKITSFKMSVAGKGIEYAEFESQSNQLTEQMKNLISRAKPGTKVYFEFIKAKMVNSADQSTRSLPAMTFVLQ